MAMKRLAARTSEQHAKFVECISSEDLIVAGITGNSKMNDGMHQSVVIIIVLSLTVAPEANKVVDTMKQTRQ